MFNGIYDKHKRMILYIFFAVMELTFLSMYLFGFYDIEHDTLKKFINAFISNVITFISICFGFYLTSLSILFSSKILKELNTEDPYKPTQRHIHTLKAYFKLAIYCSLLTIALSFVLFIISSFIEKVIVVLILCSLFLAIFVENFIFIYLLLRVFLNAFVFQARDNGEKQ